MFLETNLSTSSRNDSDLVIFRCRWTILNWWDCTSRIADTISCSQTYSKGIFPLQTLHWPKTVTNLLSNSATQRQHDLNHQYLTILITSYNSLHDRSILRAPKQQNITCLYIFPKLILALIVFLYKMNFTLQKRG